MYPLLKNAEKKSSREKKNFNSVAVRADGFCMCSIQLSFLYTHLAIYVVFFHLPSHCYLMVNKRDIHEGAGAVERASVCILSICQNITANNEKLLDDFSLSHSLLTHCRVMIPRRKSSMSAASLL